jgi:hypothetical protein
MQSIDACGQPEQAHGWEFFMALASSNRLFAAVFGAALGMATLVAQAGEAVYTSGDNVAIQGYDPVAYFTESRPVKGDPAIEQEWQGARWQFASVENRALFSNNPDQYAPRYGGFCAGGMSLGRKAPIDPEQWVIVDGKLFLNGSSGATDYFNEGREEKIAEADTNWERLGQTE